MPICKNCHSRISNFDKDICPVCGCEHPLSGDDAVPSDTIEVTHQIDNSNIPNFKSVAPRKKNSTLLFFALIGWTGYGFAYLRFKTSFVVIWLLCNLLVIGGLGALLCFLTPLSWIGFIISVCASYILNICIGLVYKFKPNMTDAKGELVL